MPYEKTYDLLDLAIKMQSSREGVSLNDICTAFNVSQGVRQTHFPRDRHHKVRYPQRRIAGRQGYAVENVGVAPCADADGTRRRDGVPDGKAETVEKQSRLFRSDEFVTL